MATVAETPGSAPVRRLGRLTGALVVLCTILIVIPLAVATKDLGTRVGVLSLGLGLVSTGAGLIVACRPIPRHELRSVGVASVALLALVMCAGDIRSLNSGLPRIAFAQLLSVTDEGSSSIVYASSGGHVGFCSRPDTAVPNTWTRPNEEGGWPVRLDGFAVFHSTYNGLEVVAITRKRGQLYFGWLGGDNHWRRPEPVTTADGLPVLNVHGTPAFLEHVVSTDRVGDTQFLAFVPVDSGGVGIWERADYRGKTVPGQWRKVGTIATSLPGISAVSAIEAEGQGLLLALRSNSTVYLMRQAVGQLPTSPAAGWSRPIAASAKGQHFSTTGNPALSYTKPPDGRRQVVLSVPTSTGVLLLSADPVRLGSTDPWTAERVSSAQDVMSATASDSVREGAYYRTISYIVNGTIFSTSSTDGSAWTEAAPLRCGSLRHERP